MPRCCARAGSHARAGPRAPRASRARSRADRRRRAGSGRTAGRRKGTLPRARVSLHAGKLSVAGSPLEAMMASAGGAPSRLGALTPELLLHVLQQGLPGKSLAMVECVSRSFAERHWNADHSSRCHMLSSERHSSGGADGATSQAACVSLPEKAAELILQRMYPDVSFKHNSNENWKWLLAKVDVFRAGVSEPRCSDEEACRGLLSAEFRGFFGGQFYHGWSAPLASSAPPSGVMDWLEETAAMGCAASQYALGCHYAVGGHEHSGVTFDPDKAGGLGEPEYFAQRARALFQSADAQKFKAARKALQLMEDPNYTAARFAEDFLLRARGTYGDYNPLLKKWLHNPEVSMTAAEVGELSTEFRDAVFTIPRDESYDDLPDQDYSLPDDVQELRQQKNMMDMLFIRAAVGAWSRDIGVWPANYTEDNEDDGEPYVPMCTAVRHMTAQESSAIAFVGNSIAFHPGVWSKNNPSTSNVEGLSTHPDIVCYERRSSRGVFTLQELVDATRAVIWLNSHNHEHHNDLASIRRTALDSANANDGTDDNNLRVQADGVGGPIPAAEFERLNQRKDIWGGRGFLGRERKFTDTRKYINMILQNAFAVVGAGPHRFCLGFDS